jgi:hypothetical protein
VRGRNHASPIPCESRLCHRPADRDWLALVQTICKPTEHNLLVRDGTRWTKPRTERHAVGRNDTRDHGVIGLITQRSLVQIQPAQPRRKSWTEGVSRSRRPFVHTANEEPSGVRRSALWQSRRSEPCFELWALRTENPARLAKQQVTGVGSGRCQPFANEPIRSR